MEIVKTELFIDIKEHLKEKADSAKLKNFGFIMAIAFAVIGTLPFLLKMQNYKIWTLPFTGLFLISALLSPQVLSPVYRIWMALGAVLGFINIRIILGVFFFIFITPIAVVLRIMGKDVLGLKFEKTWATYRKKSQKSPSFRRQF